MLHYLNCIDLFKPLVAVSDSYPAALAQIVLMMLLGLWNWYECSIISCLPLDDLISSDKSIVAGEALTGIITEPFHMFVHIEDLATWFFDTVFNV